MVGQDSIVAEVVRMTGQLNAVENWSASSLVKCGSRIGRKRGEVDGLLLNAVDETLKHVFREEGAKVVFHFIENKCHLKREAIVEKPEGFSAGLERLLGSAAPVIEKLILENFYSKLELKLEEKEGYKFSDYIRELKERDLDVEG